MLPEYKKRIYGTYTVPQIRLNAICCRIAARPHKPRKGFIACSVCTVDWTPGNGRTECSAKSY